MVHKIRALLTPSERRSAVILLGLMVVGMMLETLGLGLIIPTTAVLMERDLAASYPRLRPLLEALGNPSQARLVMGGMLALVGLYLIKALFLAFLAWYQTRFAYRVQEQLSEQLFATYLYKPYTFHLGRNSALLMNNAINEVNHFTFSCMIPGLLLITEGLVLTGIAALLLVVEPLGALIVVFVLAGSAWGFQRSTRKRVAGWGKERQYHEGLRTQRLQEGLAGAKDVKVLGRESHFLEQYRVHNARSARLAEVHQTIQQLPRLWLELLAVTGLAILVLTMMAQGRDFASIVPTLALFAAAAFRLMPSVTRILNAVHTLRYATPVVNVLYDELKDADNEPPAKATPVAAFHTSIELSGVTYTYPDGPRPALDAVSLTIRKGESVGFVGPSGCGKSTLVDIILGLFVPDAGRVMVDGQDIQQNVRGWQHQIGYVPQSVYLTDDTLKRNVAFGLSNHQIDEAAVRRAIKAAQLDEFVAGLPDGLETIVGERGVRLSGGEHQRIGIARALYHDPGVLVLDEATSALDAATELGVMRAVTALHGSKTLVIVAHRISTVAQCDRLYRLEHGKVVSAGEPSQLTPSRKLIAGA
jgi:ABC-type multidrug transport system fused ATPase/permease subunit